MISSGTACRYNLGVVGSGLDQSTQKAVTVDASYRMEDTVMHIATVISFRLALSLVGAFFFIAVTILDASIRSTSRQGRKSKT